GSAIVAAVTPSHDDAPSHPGFDDELNDDAEEISPAAATADDDWEDDEGDADSEEEEEDDGDY
ncbi:MAG: hypothetical protein H7Z43_01600, partial [Clostridia bacterium]|nr:hypothetical protein [Deltaproteobacteria bacterium]